MTTTTRRAGVTAALVGLMGAALLAAGLWLVLLGGSLYYAIAGVGLLATAVLWARQHPHARVLYAVVLGGSLAWALWEVGFDWWPLAARLDLLFLLGLWLLTPWAGRARAVREGKQPHGAPPGPARSAQGGWAQPGRRWLGLALLASAAVAVASWLRAPHDLVGQLPQAQAALASSTAGTTQPAVPPGEWHAYGRTGYGQRYSPLSSITPANAAQLKLAWEYRTVDVRGKPGDPEETTYEVTPLKIGNRLFLCTPHQSVIALNATTGKELWRYDPQIESPLALQHLTCRGLSYQPPRPAAEDRSPPAATATGTATANATANAAAAAAAAEVASGTERASLAPPPAPNAVPAGAAPVPPGSTRQPPVAARHGPTDAACAAKLFMPTADGRIIALNPDTGAVCTRFGGGTGQIDLWQHMPNLRPGAYYSTSPVVVTQRLVIVGGTVLDNASVKEQSGVIRAFDVDTGALVWNWDSGNPDDTAPLPPGRTYTPNSPNSWSISSVDEALGMVYVPMGNQPPDQWGGRRSPAAERYSSSVVALDLATGRVRWHFQTVHHDLWDYDVPAQPTLIDLQIGGENVPALVQPTKHRHARAAGAGRAGAAGCRGRRPHGTHAAALGAVVRAEAAARAGHVGRHHARPARVPHRISQAALRRPVHAPV